LAKEKIFANSPPGMAMEKNAVVEAILSRRSTRSYRPTPVPAKDLDIILRCGIHAPTAWHREPWLICAIQSAEQLEEFNGQCLPWMRDAFPAMPSISSVIYHAPALIVVFGDTAAPLAPIDCPLAAENMLLAAHSLGIASCVIGTIPEFLKTADAGRWLKRWKIPAGYQARIAIALGYPAAPAATESTRDSAKIIRIA
jgi:nitroreductase